MFVDLVFILPILVFLKFLDAYLTVWAFHNYRHFARKYVTLESYEANPLWQKDAEHGFKDWRHYSFAALLVIVLAGLYFYVKPLFWYNFLSGFALFLYLSINFEHLTHMREMEQIPGKVKGRIYYSLDYYFSTAAHNYVKFAALLLFAWIVSQDDFILGGIFGPLFIAALIKNRWQVYSKEEE